MKGGDLLQKMITHVLDSANEVITNEYDSNHQAIDLVPKDRSEANIIALEGGIVETAVKNVKGTNHHSKGLDTYGNYVKIKQNDGKTALYAHMKYGSVPLTKGQKIQKGDIIGTIGNTGNAYGKHLHLEIRNQNNNRENPLITLNETKITSKNTNTSKTTTTSKKTNVIKKSTLNKQSQFIHAPNYRYGSIVDGLKSVGIDSSYSYRKKLAHNNGITNYCGSYSQNVKLLKLLKTGLLKKV